MLQATLGAPGVERPDKNSISSRERQVQASRLRLQPPSPGSGSGRAGLVQAREGAGMMGSGCHHILATLLRLKVLRGLPGSAPAIELVLI